MTRFGRSKRTAGNGFVLLSKCAQGVCKYVAQKSPHHAVFFYVFFLFSFCLSLLSDHTVRSMSSRVCLKCWSSRNPTVAPAICQKYLSSELTVPLSSQGENSGGGVFPVRCSPQMPHTQHLQEKKVDHYHICDMARKNSALVNTV